MKPMYVAPFQSILISRWSFRVAMRWLAPSTVVYLMPRPSTTRESSAPLESRRRRQEVGACL